MKKIFYVILMLVLSFTATAQLNFSNGPNVISIAADDDDSLFTTAYYTFTFNRDVIGWGTTVSWDSIASGTATVKLQVNNFNSLNDSTWVDYPSLSEISVSDTTGGDIWDDDWFHFRFGRYVFTSDSLKSQSPAINPVVINMYVKTQK